MAILNVLKSSQLFQNWTEADISKLASLCSTKDLSGGEYLFSERDDSSAFYIIERGTIAIRKGSSAGDEDVAKMGSGSHFGEMALLRESGAPEKRSATAEALEPTLLVEIPIEPFEALLKSNMTAGFHFYRNLATNLGGRIRRTTEDLAGIRALRLRHT